LDSVSLIECRVELARNAFAAVEAAVVEQGVAAWSLYEDVLAGRAWLVGIFPDHATARAEWSGLRSRLPRRGVGAPQWREIADEDWRDSYKAHFKAWRCGPLHWVPEWERTTHRLPRGHAAVYLDPGLAFGTGNHETTRLCCRRLVEFADGLTPRLRRAWRAIDAGTGSGILAISAAKLGCKRVFAFDNDAEAVAVARENVRRNRTTAAVRVAAGELGPALRRRRADLVFANIQADVLIAHSGELFGAVAPGGLLVLSGILAGELSEVRARFRVTAGAGWRMQSRRLGEWADLALRRR
jgi:ribosomal protein L11 methyltransferase